MANNKPEGQALEAIPDNQNVLQIIATVAANPQANPDVMERLLDMQERILDRNAKESFNIDFVECQARMPSVLKDKLNKQTDSTYAKLATINKAILPHITKHGFALSFGTADSPLPDHTRITAELLHRGGHSKSYFYDCPYDLTGLKGSINKTPTHGKASATTYAERYLTTMIFNLVVMDDDDGNAANTQIVRTISDAQVDMIRSTIEEAGLNMGLWLDKVEKVTGERSLGSITADGFQKVYDTLQKAVRAKK